jgi:hypothetical protein
MENNFYKHKLIFTVLVYHFRDELNKLMEQDGAPPGATILTTNLYRYINSFNILTMTDFPYKS